MKKIESWWRNKEIKPYDNQRSLRIEKENQENP